MSQTTDLTLVGTYVMTVRSEILQPLDYTKTTFKTLFNEFTFEVEVVHPCRSTELFDPIVTDMEQVVKQPAIT